MDAEPLRSKLVTTGVELLEEEGLANLSLRAITRRAGVSHGAPRRYFPTHGALLGAIATTGINDLTVRLSRLGAGTPRERLTRACERYLEFATDRPAMFELIFRHDLLSGSGANLRALSLPLFGSLVDLVAAVPTTSTEKAWQKTIGIWTGLHGFAVLRAAHSLDLMNASDPAPVIAHCLSAYLPEATASHRPKDSTLSEGPDSSEGSAVE
ncbi:TetR/AcrR family transcriptional regulator [Kribbella sp. NBC_01245]|uniref:TetR/AcrR family transcriptional regulator n=1 Tax=Kribbella sp. NBC_01245 TaxID=2903578 RepID=UPI002E28B99B|nr:TetR/AcrR family transcriptional regulator [Kribbella sp. NBC_01245]